MWRIESAGVGPLAGFGAGFGEEIGMARQGWKRDGLTPARTAAGAAELGR